MIFNLCLFYLYFVESAQSSTHYRYPVLHEIHWGADFQSTMTRKLINETHGKTMFVLFFSDVSAEGKVCVLREGTLKFHNPCSF